MTTFKDMTDHVLADLHGYVRSQEQSTHLTAPVTSGALTIPVNNSKAVPGSGAFEIDEEIIWVDAVDQLNNSLTVPPYGRGFETTTAAAHTTGTRVISNPLFPRSAIKRAINATIGDAGGVLFAVGRTTFPFLGAQVSYPLPTAANSVLQVSWQEVGPTKAWRNVRNFRLDQEDGTSGGTGTAIQIRDGIIPGRIVQVVYAFYPAPLVNDTDVFTTVTGFSDSVEDVITYGACARLLSYLDSSRVQTKSTDPSQAAAVPVGAASNVSKQMYAMYRQRLSEERVRLLATYPTSVHYAR